MKIKANTSKMESKSLISCLITVMLFCDVGSDFTQDQKECKDQLIGLSPCITFVSGDAKSPSTTCCTELKKDADESGLYCLCVLIKDRNEPDLGFKLNATLALTLLPLCQVHKNSTVCPELLHLSPNSPEAQVFEQFGNKSGVSNSTSAADIIPSSSTKLSVKGVEKAAIVGVLIGFLLSVCISSFWEETEEIWTL